MATWGGSSSLVRFGSFVARFGSFFAPFDAFWLILVRYIWGQSSNISPGELAFWSHFGSPKSSKLELKLASTSSTDLERYFGHLEASGGRLGIDLGIISGSILGSRARHAIFVKINTAPQREQDF